MYLVTVLRSILRNTGLPVLAIMLSFSVACGPITQADLEKWSQNEEGLKRIGEMMQDDDVAFHTKVQAILTLVNKGWASRIRGIVSKYSDPVKLASEASTKLIEVLTAGQDEAAQNAREGLLQLLGTVDDTTRDVVQKALTNWAFAGVTPDKSKQEIWNLIKSRIALSQVPQLGEYAMPFVMIMIEKRVESEEWKLDSWVEFVSSLYDPKDEDTERKTRALRYKKEALEALKRNHAAIFKAMETSTDVHFDPDDILIIEKFATVDAIAYLLELVRNDKVDLGTQYKAMALAEKMFDNIVPDKEKPTRLDSLLATVVNKLPDLKDRTGDARLKQAQFVMERSGIPGLKDVPLVVENEANGKKRRSFKRYLSTKGYHPSAFIYGLASDFLEPLVTKEKDRLLNEFEEKWAKEQGAALESVPAEAPAGGGEPGASNASTKAEAKAAPATSPAKPDFSIDPVFISEFEARVDKTVTPLVEEWLAGKTLFKRLLGLAGLKYLGTPKALEILNKAAADQTDVSMYFGPGVTISQVAKNAIRGIALAKEFEELKVSAVRDKILSVQDIDGVKEKMLSDLAIPPEQLDKKYREEIQKRKDRYLKQKEKLTKILRKYQKFVRLTCLGMIKEYPSSEDQIALDKYIENTAIACRKSAESDESRKKVLDFFQFDNEVYKSAVIMGIMKKEMTRKFFIKAKARAYLRASVELGITERVVIRTLNRTRKWALSEPKLRGVVDRIVKIALDMAVEDFKKSNGERGISPDDVQEYREYIELPENYVLGAIIAFYTKFEWSEEDPATKKVVGKSLLNPVVAEAFDPDKFFRADPTLTDFLMDNYDDLWYVLQDLATLGAAETKKRWGMTDELFAPYERLDARIREAVKTAVDTAVTDKKLNPAQAQALTKYYPLFELAADLVLNQFEPIRKERLEQEKKKAEEEKKGDKQGEGETTSQDAKKKETPAAEPASPATDKGGEIAAPAASNSDKSRGRASPPAPASAADNAAAAGN